MLRLSNRRANAAVIVMIIAMTATGCVRRRLTVRTNPPGAIVHVDNQRIGTTPCSVDYVYYGTREIRMALPGYETLTVNQPLPAPWYELPGIDFISENLVPSRIEDSRTVSFNLTPQRLIPAEEVIARGEQLRRQSTPAGLAPVVPASAALPLTPGTVVADPFAGSAQSPALSEQLPVSPAPFAAPAAAPSTTPPPAPGLPDTFRY
ncbi:MAG: PEGA domain-containing protein [Planctomycetota bacterium]